jgi:hypothetical protein
MATPLIPEPDVKDWTWVLARPCPECGFDASTGTLDDLPATVHGVVAAFVARLREPGAAQRPVATTWSALEYACHVRDVCRLYTTRLQLMLTEDDPLFANWDQDATAVEDQYWAQDPASVAEELQAAAETIVRAFQAVPVADRGRTGRRSDGAVFTVDSFGRYFVHDLVHHAWDIDAAR